MLKFNSLIVCTQRRAGKFKIYGSMKCLQSYTYALFEKSDFVNEFSRCVAWYRAAHVGDTWRKLRH